MENKMIGNIFLYGGRGLIIAVVIKVVIESLINLLKFESINFWSILLILGFIFSSIGLGLTKSKK